MTVSGISLKGIIKDHVFKENISEIGIENKIIINTINPHSYREAKKDNVFAKSLLNSDILLPDGIGIVLAAKILNGERIVKIAGADIHRYLLEKAQRLSLKVFYLGASEETLNLIKKRINKTFPNIKVGVYSPPFKEEFSKSDNCKMIKAINEFKPTILFIGMTAPKQEKWVYANRQKLDSKVVGCIGAVFDFYAGTVNRSGDIWIRLGLEWLPRLLKEPKRLWKRNFISTPLFLLDILKEKMN